MSSTASGRFEPDLSQWDAWTPHELAARLAGIDAPWYVAAGWAIELFLGGSHRSHDDLEIAVPRERFRALARAFAGYEWFVLDNGLVWPLARAGDRIDASHQTWLREPATGRWKLDIFREPGDGVTWRYRRDERIHLPWREAVDHTPGGIPYLRPELVLLFKASRPRPKDEHDFAAVLPQLAPRRRAWLAQSLALAHPGHPWIARLA